MARQQMHPRRSRGGRETGPTRRGSDDGGFESAGFADQPEHGGGRAGSDERGGRHSAWQMQRDWDEDRYGYPEATGYAREMNRLRSDYEPEGRFARDDERGESPGYRRGQGWNESGTGQYGYGGVIDENDYRRYGGDGGRSSGGGYGMPRGYGAMGDYGAEGLWRGDASRGGRGGATGPLSSRPGRYARQGPKGYSRGDDRIREDVCERLYHADDVDVSDVSVEVSGGTVKLEGTVPERWMKYRIEDICDRAPGVTDIENRIRLVRTEAPTRHGAEQPTGPRH